MAISSHAAFTKQLDCSNFQNQETNKIKQIQTQTVDMNFLIYKEQIKKNEHDNWVQKRKEDGKDFSEELYEKIKSYLVREERAFKRFYKESLERATKRERCTGIKAKDGDIMYETKQALYRWREDDEQHKELKEEIEEFRDVSDKPLKSVEEDIEIG